MSVFPDGLYQWGGVPVGGIDAFGVGHVYFVMNSGHPNYAQISSAKTRTYNDDGTSLLHTDIQSALNACTDARNDYVIVYPNVSSGTTATQDYDLTATLTLSKRNVHLLAAGAFTMEYGCNNAVRLHQTGADLPIFTVSAQACEIAGFYLKNVASSTAASTGLYATTGCSMLGFHHNYFTLNGSGATNSPLIATSGGDGVLGYSQIYRNKFVTLVSGLTFATIIGIGAPAYFTSCDYNDFFISSGTTATVCISNGALYGSCKFNTFTAAGPNASYGQSAGVIAKAIYVDTSGCAIGNTGGVLTTTLVSGGTDERSFCQNFDAAVGGATAVES